MKNIHVLPTDKPSRLGYIFDNLILNSKLLSPTLYKNQNIYITDDSNIKEVDWVLGDFSDNPIGKVISKYGQEFTAQSLNGDKYGLAEYDSKKIILTTDQDLIADGVQSIDDEFLHWFIQNPNCERVEISYGLLKPFQSNYAGYIIHLPDTTDVLEEPKHIEDEFETQSRIINKVWDEEEPKQETLEEVAKKQWGNVHRTGVLGFIEGAKWQQKKMYSDMQEYAKFCIECDRKEMPLLLVQDWYEHYKK